MKSTTLISLTTFFFGAAHSCSTVSNSQITFYGWPDNDPPSAQTAYNCGGRNFIAGGSGTFSDPVTFASAPGEYSQCEVVYVPYLKKYARLEDSCAQCITDKNNGKNHIDVWTGSSTGSGGQAQIDCEDDLTGAGAFNRQIIRQPASTYAVDSTKLYLKGSSDGTDCRTSHVFENNPASNYC